MTITHLSAYRRPARRWFECLLRGWIILGLVIGTWGFCVLIGHILAAITRLAAGVAL